MTRLPSLNGDAEYGRCVDCTTLDGGRGRAEFVRSVVSRLLEVDVDNLALDGLRVDMFSERPSARPDRPNLEPWSHAALDALAGQYREREATLAGCAGGPCAWCGITVTGLQRIERVTLNNGSTVTVPDGGGWRSLRGGSDLGSARGDLEQCESCTHWFNERWGGYGSQVRVFGPGRAALTPAARGAGLARVLLGARSRSQRQPVHLQPPLRPAGLPSSSRQRSRSGPWSRRGCSAGGAATLVTMKLRHARGDTWELAWRHRSPVGSVGSVAGFSEWAGQEFQSTEPATSGARLVILVDDTLSISTAAGVAQQVRSFVAGPRAVPVTVGRPGSYRGFEVALTVAAAAALIGMPVGELGGSVTALNDVLDDRARQLHDRLGRTRRWDDAFEVIDDCLASRHTRVVVDARLRRAWEAIELSAGRVSVGSIAEEIGWSRRHLASSFQRTFGVTPKVAARLFRFERATRVLRTGTAPAVAATVCGYFDQAHMHRDFAMFDGRTPGRVADVPTGTLEAAWPVDGS